MEQKSIIRKAQTWADSPHIDDKDRQTIQNSIDQSDWAYLAQSFQEDLCFGTGGIRARIGLGTGLINIYNIRRATQALANTLRDYFSQDISLCIGFDCRKFSQLFAHESAQVMAANGIRVHLFDHITPTPLVSYAIRFFKAQGGVMVTASHNPRDYNGCKVYWDDGRQVTPPHDNAIIDHYEKLASLEGIQTMDFKQACLEEKISIINPQCEDDYYQMIAGLCLAPELCQKQGPHFPIAFTPLHGTGGGPVTRALAQIGLTNIHLVDEQAGPDENFPTVAVPNPEEPAALERVMALMRAKGASLALAVDPDTDRLGVVAQHEGELHLLNGNQVGLLLLHYILQTKKQNGTLGENPLFIKTIVTSELLAQVARSYGCLVENTLTGFKWICQKMGEYEQKGIPFDFILGTEESFGYLSHPHCRDKDGVNACTLMAEVALFYHSKGQTLIDALNAIYQEYGHSHESLLALYYDGIEGKAKIERILSTFKQTQGPFPGLGKPSQIDSPHSSVVGLHFDQGNKIYIRPSGTEPKIKFYIMLVENTGTLEEKKQRAHDKAKMIKNFLLAQCEEI